MLDVVWEWLLVFSSLSSLQVSCSTRFVAQPSCSLLVSNTIPVFLACYDDWCLVKNNTHKLNIQTWCPVNWEVSRGLAQQQTCQPHIYGCTIDLHFSLTLSF